MIQRTKRPSWRKVCTATAFVLGCLATNTPSIAQWTAIGSSTGISAAGSSYQSLTKDAAGNLYVAYHDSSVAKGSVMKYNGTSWTYVGGSAGITGGTTLYNSIAINSSNSIFYAYQDATAALKLTAKQFNGTSWINTWQNISNGSVYSSSIKIGPSGYPYAVYRDISLPGSNLAAKRFDGTNWLRLGNAGFGFAGTTYYPSMAIGSNDTVYVSSVTPLAAVQVFKIHALADSTTATWQPVGTTGFAASSSNSIFQFHSSIAIDASNRLYVAFVSSAAEGNKIKVKMYEHGQWTSVGTDNFSPGSATYVSIAVTPSGTPYVAFRDGVNGNKITVMKYDGTQWAIVGAAGISAGAASYTSLTLDAAGNPVVAFTDAGNNNKTVVMKYTPPCAGDPSLVVGSTGCVTFPYNGATVTYTTVRGADGNVWLQQNMGSTQVATAQADTNAYGDTFQWGRWDDSHQKRNAVTGAIPAPNNPTGIGTGMATYFTGTPTWWLGGAITDTWNATTPAAVSVTDGCDPCKSIGAGWHLPSQTEWATIVSSEGMTTIAQAVSSNLKLPMAGNRTGTGAFDFTGARGYYWSSTTSSSGAKYLYCGTTLINANAGGPRYQGMSIRCLKNMVSNIDSIRVGVLNNGLPEIANNGGTLQMTANIYPATLSQNVTWSIVAGTGTATISATGLVTAQTNGTVWAKATAVTDATKKDSMLVTITNQVVPVASIIVATQGNVSPVITINGGFLQMTATILPATANQAVTWSMINGTGTATISTTGFVVAQTNGTVWAKAVSVSDVTKKDSMQITITNQIIPIDSINVTVLNNASPVISTRAGTLQLVATVYPLTANQSVVWSANPASVGIVSNTGLVSAVANGAVWVKAITVQNAAMSDSILVTINNQATGINQLATAGDIILYPNPATNQVIIENKQAKAGMIRIVDMQGRTLKQFELKANSPATLDVSMLAEGWYLVLPEEGGLGKALKFLKKN